MQMEKNFNKTIMDQLFHSDFKLHIKAIEALMKVCQYISIIVWQVSNLANLRQKGL